MSWDDVREQVRRLNATAASNTEQPDDGIMCETCGRDAFADGALAHFFAYGHAPRVGGQAVMLNLPKRIRRVFDGEQWTP